MVFGQDRLSLLKNKNLSELEELKKEFVQIFHLKWDVTVFYSNVKFNEYLRPDEWG